MSEWGAFGVSVRFGEVLALDDVTLVLPRGQVVAVVGGDGAGKSTLLRSLTGRVPLAAGRVSAPALRDVGYMPTTAGTWADLTVDEHVEFVGAAYGLRGTDLAARRERLLATTGLGRAHDRTAAALSGGMRQKLAFALAVLHAPRLVVLDEPSTGVDPVSRVELWRMIAHAAAAGAAVVLATTYLDEAERASSVLVLDAGRALLSGPPDEVVSSAPGSVRRPDHPGDPRRTWRRGRELREWFPDSTAATGQGVLLDLEDAVVAASLAEEARRG